MNIAPYWARSRVDLDGRPEAAGEAVAFGWSFTSQAEAESHALERAKNKAQRHRMIRDTAYEDWDTPATEAAWMRLTPPEVHDQVDGTGCFADDYYGDRPVREPILEHYGEADAPWALVTRNRYGARVLNTAGAMFVDADLPPRPRDRRTFWDRWWRQVPPPAAPDPTQVLDRLRAVVAAHPGMGLRVYRTKAGFRGLLTHRPFAPDGDDAKALLEAFGADPLYRQLCQVQGCFRARLTPKPWRVGWSSPPVHWFPYSPDPERKAAWAAWLEGYEAACRGFAVAELVEHLGEVEVHPEVAPVLELHDQEVLGEGALA